MNPVHPNPEGSREPATIEEMAGIKCEPSLEQLEAAWSELWKQLGEPDYSPSAISLAKHCFMVGQEWGRNHKPSLGYTLYDVPVRDHLVNPQEPQ